MKTEKRIAVIGSGISGLASAWLLERSHDVTLYEAAPELGGHTHTVDVTLEGRTHPVDTGFLVFNDQTYPIEKYAEVTVAMEFLGKQGRDAQDVLKDFGLTVADYSNLGSYYTKKIFMSPMGLGMKFQNCIMEYRAKYEKIIQEDGTHDDIKF